MNTLMSALQFFTAARTSTQRIMQIVILALMPGLLVSVYFFGLGILTNLVVSLLTVILVEAMILKIRKQDITLVGDGSAAITGILLGLALPPDLPFWMVIIGAGFAIIFGKHLYGGIGQNPFNPAMVGYAVLIISFPLAMSTWPIAANSDLINQNIDAFTAATPLDTFKFRGAQTIDEIWTQANGFSQFAGTGWQWINLAYLLGGLALVYFRVARWQGAASMLLVLIILAALFYDNGSSQSLGSPLFHLFSGGTMLVAFFLVTDPVTSPDSDVGLVIFGAGVGLITFIIRSYGGYPDGFAFALLLMNAVTPLIDHVRLRAS